MELTDLIVGATYANASGKGQRRIVRFLDSVRRQGTQDTVEYESTAGYRKGRRSICTTITFAHWAKTIVAPAAAEIAVAPTEG